MKSPKSAEVKYRRELNALVASLVNSVRVNVVPLLKQLEPEYVGDGYASTLEQVFDNLRKNYVDINDKAKIVSNSFVEGVNNTNSARFYKSIESSIGVNMSNIIQNEGLEDIMVATTRENVGLIRSIPEEYFKKIETAVFTGTTQSNKANSMIKQIQEIGGSTFNRAKLIARDQTSKLNSALNQQRQQNLGIEEYVWRTAGDNRERPNHASKDGKTFRWDSPPKDTGHPGEDIQCRCYAQPIINL